MTQSEAVKFVTNLKQRNVNADEARAIALSVVQSERFSDGDVNRIKSWIETEKPSLETIEVRAERMRKEREPAEKGSFKAMSAPRLFREIPELAR